MSGDPGIFGLSRVEYYADQWIFGALTPLILIYAFSVSGIWVVPLFVTGVLAWGFTEYWVHRVILHSVAPFDALHDVHHTNPKDYVGVSPAYTLTVFFVLALALALLVGPVVGSGVLAGYVSGYLYYIVIHDWYHHGDPRPAHGPFWRQYLRHVIHHGKNGDTNFGVSYPLWDRVFGTYRPLPRR